MESWRIEHKEDPWLSIAHNLSSIPISVTLFSSSEKPLRSLLGQWKFMPVTWQWPSSAIPKRSRSVTVPHPSHSTPSMTPFDLSLISDPHSIWLRQGHRLHCYARWVAQQWREKLGRGHSCPNEQISYQTLNIDIPFYIPYRLFSSVRREDINIVTSAQLWLPDET